MPPPLPGLLREIILQVCNEMGVTIIKGALSKDHVHMLVEIPPHISVSDFVRRAKGCGLVTVLRRSPISLCHLSFECERADAAQI